MVTVLTAQEREIAGPFVYYAVGTTAGAMYGLPAEQRMDLKGLLRSGGFGLGLPFCGFSGQLVPVINPLDKRY